MYSSLLQAFSQGYTVDRISELTGIDLWFLHKLEDIFHLEKDIKDAGSL